MRYIICLIITINCSLSAREFRKYELKCNPRLLEYTMIIAREQLGISEYDCRNRGQVDKYLELFNADAGSPYCYAGIYYCFYYACNYLSIDYDSIPIPKTMLANRVYDFAKTHGEKAGYAASIGDLLIWRRSNSIFGHIEMVHKVTTKGWVHTIGFNTSKYINNRKVCGVYEHKRNIYHPLGRLAIRGIVGFKV